MARGNQIEELAIPIHEDICKYFGVCFPRRCQSLLLVKRPYSCLPSHRRCEELHTQLGWIWWEVRVDCEAKGLSRIWQNC